MRDILREVKWAWQRVSRGYDDRLYWGMDEYLDPIIIAGLKNLRNNGNGYPCLLSQKKWNSILDIMITAFQTDKYEYTEESKEQRNRGLKLFARYYNHLWD